MNIMSKNKRALNFSAKEEMVLVSLAKKYKGMLECKLTDTKTHHQKTDSWLSIEKEFNSAAGEVHRPVEVLRKKYDNIKKRVKKKFADEKCYRKGTGGGGSPLDIIFTDIDEEIKNILGARINGSLSEFDDNAEVTVEVTDFIGDEQPQNEEGHLVEHNYKISNVDICIPSTSKIGNEETGKRKQYVESSTSKRISQWADAKSQVEKSRTAFLKEEFDLKLEQIRERHEQEMNKSKLKMEWLKKEHELSMEILELEKLCAKNKMKK